MAPIGKEMVLGTYQQMTHKMWQHKILRMELEKYLLRAIAAECSELCSTKTASMSRRCSSDDMLNSTQKPFVKSGWKKPLCSIPFLCLPPCQGEEKM